MGSIPTELLQLLVGAVNVRRIRSVGNGLKTLNHIRNTVGVGDNHFSRFLSTEIIKLLQHLVRGTEIQGSLIIRIIKAFTGHQNATIRLILGIHKVHVTGCTNRNI